MTPDLAQVLNTLAHEIRTPLSVSQGYLKLFLDGRLKDGDEARRALEQARQALGTLATLCLDMGKVSTLSNGGRGIPTRVTAGDFLASLRARDEVAGAQFSGEPGGGAIETSSAADLAQAAATVAKAAFTEDRAASHAIEAVNGDGLRVLAGTTDALTALRHGPGAQDAQPVDYSRGGHGLKLIWAAFVLAQHGVQTWTTAGSRASVGFHFPLVHA